MDHSGAASRRRFLKGALVAGALVPALSLSGCELLKAVGKTCPADPAESGGIDWLPDVLHPVFYGFKDFGTADGAPRNLRVWYPTYEGFTNGPPLLKLCLVRWPVVLFLHGQQPPSCQDADYYQRWTSLPAVLARSGYVVVVPGHAANFPDTEGGPAVDDALAVLDWVRNGWEHAAWVAPQAEATAVAGHSYGALLAARVAQARSSISAYVGLSGPWLEFSSPGPVLQAIGDPSLFMWTTGDPVIGAMENLDGGGLWNAIPGVKHGAVLPGEHFDYLRPWSGCNFTRGSCAAMDVVAAELTALFLERYLSIADFRPGIPVTLEPPTVMLTTKQKLFAGGHLSGLAQIQTQSNCRIELRWEDAAGPGSRLLGPP